MTKEEFRQAIHIEYDAETLGSIVYVICAKRKTLYVQILDEYVNIMMNNFNDIKKSYTCGIEVRTSKGEIDFDIAYTKLESMINE